MEDQKNTIIAIALSALVLMGWYYFYEGPRIEAEQARIEAEQAAAQKAQNQAQIDTMTEGVASMVPNAPTAPAAASTPQQIIEQALSSAPRIKIETPRLQGSLSLQGGRIDDLQLVNYREELDEDSPLITLLAPTGTKNPYYAEFGWTATDSIALPDANTRWSASGEKLTVDTPVTLMWDNGQGLLFKRTYAVDKDFMFTVTQSVTNTSDNTKTLFPYGLINRTGQPETSGIYILHEGLLGVFDETLQEVDYSDLIEDGNVTSKSASGGWVGITDKYWMTALAPPQDQQMTGRFSYIRAGQLDKFQADYLGDGQTIAPGQTSMVNSYFFAGAKEVKVIDSYQEDFGISRFDLTIDWGWFYFLTKPIFSVIHWFYGLLGNFGLAIIALTVIIKLAFFPLANKSYVAMSKMKKLQPEMVKLRERFKDDKAKQQQELMDLYRREKVNPMAGCLPILVQIPVFFALYKVLYVTIEMRQAPFYGWIEDLSVRDPTSLFNLFGLIPWTPPEFLMIGIWPLLMGISMFMQMRLNPAPQDELQAKMFMFMPILFTFLLGSFPAGLVIYWTVNNVLSILQQAIIMKRMGVEINFRLFGAKES